jgi:hypothetical protein
MTKLIDAKNRLISITVSHKYLHRYHQDRHRVTLKPPTTISEKKKKYMESPILPSDSGQAKGSHRSPSLTSSSSIDE